MKLFTIDKLVWALIYAGLLVAGFGVSVWPSRAVMGGGLIILGSLAALAGVVLIYVRSRMKNEP